MCGRDPASRHPRTSHQWTSAHAFSTREPCHLGESKKSSGPVSRCPPAHVGVAWRRPRVPWLQSEAHVFPPCLLGPNTEGGSGAPCSRSVRISRWQQQSTPWVRPCAPGWPIICRVSFVLCVLFFPHIGTLLSLPTCLQPPGNGEQLGCVRRKALSEGRRPWSGGGGCRGTPSSPCLPCSAS